MTKEQLIARLYEMKRSHEHCDDSWYCCRKCVDEDHGGALGSHGGTPTRVAGECNCGVDRYNDNIDALINDIRYNTANF